YDIARIQSASQKQEMYDRSEKKFEIEADSSVDRSVSFTNVNFIKSSCNLTDLFKPSLYHIDTLQQMRSSKESQISQSMKIVIAILPNVYTHARAVLANHYRSSYKICSADSST
ncbi:hypothetical protein L9F63_020410, partial [Diploptera punctata]